MNVSILNDDNYVKEIKQCIAMCENEYTNENPQVKWKICKIQAKELTQSFCKRKARQSRKEIHEFEKKLCDLEEKLIMEKILLTFVKIIQKKNHTLNIIIVRNIKELA